MGKYYKTAITLYALQLFFLSVLLNSITIIRISPDAFHAPGAFEPYLGGIILALSITSILVIRSIYNYSLKNMRNKAELIRLKNIEEQNRIYRQHRHDLYNHLTVISGLAQLGRLDKLRDYLSGYLDNFNRSIITVNTGLKELDVLLYAKIAEARDKGIDVNYCISDDVKCSQQFVVGMMTILANALDNAIKAALKAQAKKMEIEITSDDVNYELIIANTYDQSIDLSQKLTVDGFTTKRGSNRGEGLSIIRKTVLRLQGSLEYKIDEGWCRLNISLPRQLLEGAS